MQQYLANIGIELIKSEEEGRLISRFKANETRRTDAVNVSFQGGKVNGTFEFTATFEWRDIPQYQVNLDRYVFAKFHLFYTN